jgi:hypothetical protein
LFRRDAIDLLGKDSHKLDTAPRNNERLESVRSNVAKHLQQPEEALGSRANRETYWQSENAFFARARCALNATAAKPKMLKMRFRMILT